VTAGSKSGNEPRSNVDAGRNREAIAGLNRARTRENPVEPDFALEFLNLVERNFT
jgi:hypothetical protein